MPFNKIEHQDPRAFQFGNDRTTVEKQSSTTIIITDLITSIIGPESGDVVLNKRSLWMKIVNGAIFILNDAPANLPADPDSHGDWELSRIVIEGAKVYIVQYNDPSKEADYRVKLTSYEPSVPASDELLVHIDQTENVNTCTVYYP